VVNLEEQETLEHYIRVAKLLGDMFAKSSCVEVLVHDLRREGFPILAIFNGHLTGRYLGHSTSVYGSLDADLKRLPDAVSNYVFVGPNGKRFVSSSLTIRNKKGQAIGAFSVNFDTSVFEQMSAFLQQFVMASTVAKPPAPSQPEGPSGVLPQDALLNEIHKVIMHNNFHLHALSREDKQHIVQELHQAGLLQRHGMVTLLATELRITRATVYKYVRMGG